MEAGAGEAHEGLGGGPFSVPRTVAWRRAALALRAPGWWYFALLPLVTMAGGGHVDEAVVLRVASAVLVAALCLAYAYGLNDITDRRMDVDAAKNSLAGLSGIPREAAVLVGACAVGSLAIAAALVPVALPGAGVSLAAATLYSANPRLKRFPLIGTLVNVLIFAPLPLLAATRFPSPPAQFLTYCFWVLVTQNQILHEVADGQEDVSGGVRTTGVAAGAMGLRVIALVLGPFVVLPLWQLPVVPVTRFAATLGLCAGAAMVAACRPESAARLRVAHRWLALAVGVVLFALMTGGAA